MERSWVEIVMEEDGNIDNVREDKWRGRNDKGIYDSEEEFSREKCVWIWNNDEIWY